MNQKLSLSTHILDINLGKPAEGVSVKLSKLIGNSWIESSENVITDENGRFKNFNKIDNAINGTYRLRFKTKEYFSRIGTGETLYPYIDVN